MRHLILSLACACAACGGGGGTAAERIEFCQSIDSLSGDVMPGFVILRDAAGTSATDEFGFSETGEAAAEDWISHHAANGGGPPVADGEECGSVVGPGDLLGRTVLDYGTGDFLLLATEADVDAFLNR